jgi:hypothetical protein
MSKTVAMQSYTARISIGSNMLREEASEGQNGLRTVTTCLQSDPVEFAQSLAYVAEWCAGTLLQNFQNFKFTIK